MQIKALVCCDTVDMLGDLWVSMFSAGSVAVVLLIVTFAYIGKLDRLPRRRCTPFCLICSQDYFKTVWEAHAVCPIKRPWRYEGIASRTLCFC